MSVISDEDQELMDLFTERLTEGSFDMIYGTEEMIAMPGQSTPEHDKTKAFEEEKLPTPLRSVREEEQIPEPVINVVKERPKENREEIFAFERFIKSGLYKKQPISVDETALRQKRQLTSLQQAISSFTKPMVRENFEELTTEVEKQLQAVSKLVVAESQPTQKREVHLAKEEKMGFIRFHINVSAWSDKFMTTVTHIDQLKGKRGQEFYKAWHNTIGCKVEIETESIVIKAPHPNNNSDGKHLKVYQVTSNKNRELMWESVFSNKSGMDTTVYYVAAKEVSSKVFWNIRRELPSKLLSDIETHSNQLKVYLKDEDSSRKKGHAEQLIEEMTQTSPQFAGVTNIQDLLLINKTRLLTDYYRLSKAEPPEVLALLETCLKLKPQLSRIVLEDICNRWEYYQPEAGVKEIMAGFYRLTLWSLRKIPGYSVIVLRLRLEEEHFQTRITLVEEEQIGENTKTEIKVIDCPTLSSLLFAESAALLSLLFKTQANFITVGEYLQSLRNSLNNGKNMVKGSVPHSSSLRRIQGLQPVDDGQNKQSSHLTSRQKTISSIHNSSQKKTFPEPNSNLNEQKPKIKRQTAMKSAKRSNEDDYHLIHRRSRSKFERRKFQQRGPTTSSSKKFPHEAEIYSKDHYLGKRTLDERRTGLQTTPVLPSKLGIKSHGKPEKHKASKTCYDEQLKTKNMTEEIEIISSSSSEGKNRAEEVVSAPRTIELSERKDIRVEVSIIKHISPSEFDSAVQIRKQNNLSEPKTINHQQTTAVNLDKWSSSEEEIELEVTKHSNQPKPQTMTHQPTSKQVPKPNQLNHKNSIQKPVQTASVTKQSRTQRQKGIVPDDYFQRLDKMIGRKGK